MVDLVKSDTGAVNARVFTASRALLKEKETFLGVIANGTEWNAAISSGSGFSPGGLVLDLVRSPRRKKMLLAMTRELRVGSSLEEIAFLRFYSGQAAIKLPRDDTMFSFADERR